MALTFTVAGLQSELSTYGEAMASADYTTARSAIRKGRAIRLGLPDSAEALGAKVAIPSLQWFDEAEKGIDAAEAAASATDRRRLIRTGLRHG